MSNWLTFEMNKYHILRPRFEHLPFFVLQFFLPRIVVIENETERKNIVYFVLCVCDV